MQKTVWVDAGVGNDKVEIKAGNALLVDRTEGTRLAARNDLSDTAFSLGPPATLIASKAARVVQAAAGRTLVDFGMRRAHGAGAALCAARAAFLAGFDATATVEAGRRYGIPLSGTMAHSFVQAGPSELEALRGLVRARGVPTTL